MITDAQGNGIVLACDPLGQAILMRHQPGVRAWPAASQALLPDLWQIIEQEVELFDVVGHHDQPLVHRPLLERQQAIHRRFVPGIAAQAPDCLGRIGDHAPSRTTRAVCCICQLLAIDCLPRNQWAAVYPNQSLPATGLNGLLSTARQPTPGLGTHQAIEFQLGQRCQHL